MSTALVWLRNDLRPVDNPALASACATGAGVTAVYIHETDSGLRPPGGAARWWLHHSLNTLSKQLAGIGIELRVERGEAIKVLADLIAATGATSVYWNRRYAPVERAVDARIKETLIGQGIMAMSHVGNVLAEPWTIETGQGRPYSVFSPFWKSLRDKDIARPLPAPDGQAIEARAVDSDYRQPGWAEKLAGHWTIGADAAARALDDFLSEIVADYPQGRDFPGKSLTSRLSPHLRFGEISSRQVWHAAKAMAHADPHLAAAVDKFLSELAWRDFSYHQLYHRSDIAEIPMQARYADLSWRQDPGQLRAWQRGQTGIPIVDAGMRELWQTGYMHNRVRMLTASFLTKNLLIDWRNGEKWFWDCLVDADRANNPASWQWVAGCGLDAAPYFRIFNPVTQGERFDANGAYVRQWVPELAALPDKWIHRPYEAPRDALEAGKVVLGQTYPAPIVDLRRSRQRALEAVAAL